MKWFWIIIGVLGIAALSGGEIIMSKLDQVIDTMAAAIQNFEGGKPGDRNMRNNNPGNIRWASGLPQWLIDLGATGKDSADHVIFSTYQQGLDTLKRQLRMAFTGSSSVYSPAMSLYEFFGKYAEANQQPYAEYVASELGVDPNQTLGEIAS
jgi:hypothetical protein